MINEVFGKVPEFLGQSKFLPVLARRYALAPSAVLIRAAEVELLNSIYIEPPALDLCCGDGYFANLIHPLGFEAGCDFDRASLNRADKRNIYRHLTCVDITRGIPYPDGSFDTIVSNSSLEHVDDIDGALQEIRRILKPGGRLYTTFASHFAYEWWPCGDVALNRYLEFQPVHNYFPIQEWEYRMNKAGLRVLGYRYYLSKHATQTLFFLDYHLSHVFQTSDKTIARPIIGMMGRISPKIWAWLWKKLFANIRILVPEEGGGIYIVVDRESL